MARGKAFRRFRKAVEKGRVFARKIREGMAPDEAAWHAVRLADNPKTCSAACCGNPRK